MNTSIFVPSSSEGLTSAVCPDVYSYFSVYLGHYLGYPPREPCAVPVGPAGAQLHLAHSLWRHQRCEDKVTLFRKYSTTASNGEFSRKKTHSCWPEHMELVGCYVRAGQKWKITGAIKLERTDCQTEGKQVFEAIIVTLGCVLTIMWHHIFLSLPSPHFSTWHALTAAQHYCWQHSTLASTMIPQILWIGSWFWNNGLNVVSLGWIQGIQECQEGCGGPEESQE